MFYFLASSFMNESLKMLKLSFMYSSFAPSRFFYKCTLTRVLRNMIVILKFSNSFSRKLDSCSIYELIPCVGPSLKNSIRWFHMFILALCKYVPRSNKAIPLFSATKISIFLVLQNKFLSVAFELLLLLLLLLLLHSLAVHYVLITFWACSSGYHFSA